MAAYYHKRFRRLGIYVSYESHNSLPFRQILAIPLIRRYSVCLRGLSFNGIHSINLYLTTIPAESNMVTKEVVGFADYYALFDFYAFAQLETDQERQLYLLDVIQRATRILAHNEQWDTSRFERAYQECLRNDLPVSILH